MAKILKFDLSKKKLTGKQLYWKGYLTAVKFQKNDEKMAEAIKSLSALVNQMPQMSLYATHQLPTSGK